MRLYTAEEVHAALDYPKLIAALRDAFQAGGEKMPVRQAYEVGMPGLPAHLLTMPAWRRGNAIGVKLVTVVPGNASRNLGAVSSLFVLFDGVTGVPRAIIDAKITTSTSIAVSACTSRRTPAISAAESAKPGSALARLRQARMRRVGWIEITPSAAKARIFAQNTGLPI